MDSMRLLILKLLIDFHGGTIGSLLGTRLPSYRSFLVNHLPRNGNNVVLDQLLADVLDVCMVMLAYQLQFNLMEWHTLLRIHLAHVSCLQLFLGQLSLLLHSLLVALGKGDKLLHLVDVVLALLVEIVHL